MKKSHIALIILVLIQFIQIDKSNTPIDPQKDFFTTTNLSTDAISLIKDACQDCHSESTTYPWYSYVQPVGWFLRSHTRGGKQKLNFSTWNSISADRQRHIMEECIEVINEKRMPMKSYTFLHPKAKLTDTQRSELVAFFESQL